MAAQGCVCVGEARARSRRWGGERQARWGGERPAHLLLAVAHYGQADLACRRVALKARGRAAGVQLRSMVLELAHQCLDDVRVEAAAQHLSGPEGSGIGEPCQGPPQPLVGTQAANASPLGPRELPRASGGAYNWSGGWPHHDGLLRARARFWPRGRTVWPRKKRCVSEPSPWKMPAISTAM